MKLELVPIPVTDVERAKAFYVDKLDFHVDHDTRVSDRMRVIQLTPPGSACSIVMGTGMAEIDRMQPGSQSALHLVVGDAAAARAMLVSRGVAAGDVQDLGRGVKYVGFTDPDGNSWVFQEIPWRASEFSDERETS
jgi:catechol 2,3-dioxygenase-like lactoylglutathione lyase family enzyme